MATLLVESRTPESRDEGSHSETTTVELSVVCPFYNEAAILPTSLETMLDRLMELDCRWELIVVNDGSTDDSEQVAREFEEQCPQLRVISYAINRGRGYALRQGINAARGDIIVTTEIDLSWGDDIVERLYKPMVDDPSTDVLVASPNLPGGGYKNVPRGRVWVSRLGNRVIRGCMSNAVTMNTGMTRAYRREVIQSMPLEENRKEFHLEVIVKAQAMGYRMREIPCFLEWKDYKHKGQRVKRKSSSKVRGLIFSHTLFSLFAKPIRYVWALSGAAFLLSVGFFVWSVVRLMMGLVSVFTLNICLALAIIAVALFALGVICQQGFMIQKELWTLKRELHLAGRNEGPGN